ncbi:MutS-related protein [Flavobacterium cerinum]|uniref:DNA mismatch repair protein n=1 Tax=Flavobacterium cerinum TaxID=2502784 RepID=A0A444HB43_9FLAO|nr:DNA mismatch repair protein [Flavobacterium cerinum]RWX00557.1 DNA mismatch repair protein [Flavobacterium cerinum]
MEFYKNRKETFQLELKKLNFRYNIISASRLLIAVAFIILGYYSIQPEKSTLQFSLMAICFILFLLLMKRHALVHQKKLRAATLVKINSDEIAYLEGKIIPFEDGAEFVDFRHPYSHDLDIFGQRSLFHNINRTQTYKGNEKLAELLQSILSDEEIILNQDAVKELASKPELRQEIMALGKARKDNLAVYTRLISWANSKTKTLSVVSIIIGILIPVVLTICIISYLVTNNQTLSTIAGWLFLFNLLFLLSYLKLIKNEVKHTTEIHDIIHHYGLIIEQLENEKFTSKKLQLLKKNLVTGGKSASGHIKELASLFSRLDSIDNALGAIFLNGIMLYHFHSLNALYKWKKNNEQNVALWLDIIAEVESLSSFGNLYYNNGDFIFPNLNTNYIVAFRNIAHPLLKKENRIGNDISFNSDFMILTGSNMSGKSTFLRSLGINMVLAGAGAPVCASNADIHPLPVLVSMRLSDSLSDSESYFFAEIKRLRYIMDKLQDQHAFVLLDEILRGTNSDDKRTGTIKVVKKMIALKATGAIATHDIEVCNIVGEYPHSLVNRCFEAKIVDNELYFDYQLRDGICRNKSATFLMEKMGVI